MSNNLPAFQLFGYVWDSKGRITGPDFLQSSNTINEARVLVLALLSFGSANLMCVEILDRKGKQIAMYRRFPAGRERVPSLDALPDRILESAGRGARLAKSENGRRRAF